MQQLVVFIWIAALLVAAKYFKFIPLGMAATFEFDKENGSSGSSTVTHNVTNINWKNVDDHATAYSSSPIDAGNNSFTVYAFGHYSGTYNTLQGGLWAHTAGAMGTGLTIKGQPAMTADGDRLSYATPATSANAGLTFDDTPAIAIASGRAVWFGVTGPGTAGKAASSTANPAYTNYLATQLQTTGSAAPGDTATATFTLRHQES